MIKLYPMIKVSENKQGGFTLIEIILTLVIAAVVGAGLVQYLGSAFVKSPIPIQRLKKVYALQHIMENITADYIESVVNGSDDLDDLQASINTPGNYSTSTPPTLYTVKFNKFIKFTPSQFEDTVAPSKKNILKVTIKIKNGSDVLTTLFTEQ